MKERHTVSCFIRHKGKILLLKRSDRVGSYRRKWAVVHGFLDINENPDTRARIEIEEELGIKTPKTIKKGNPFKILDEKRDIVWNVYPYLFEIDSDEIRLDWEHTDFIWINPEEIKNFDIPLGMYDVYKTLGEK